MSSTDPVYNLLFRGTAGRYTLEVSETWIKGRLQVRWYGWGNGVRRFAVTAWCNSSARTKWTQAAQRSGWDESRIAELRQMYANHKSRTKTVRWPAYNPNSWDWRETYTTENS